MAVEANKTANNAMIAFGNSGTLGVGEDDWFGDAVGRIVAVGVLWMGVLVGVGFVVGFTIGTCAGVGVGWSVGTGVKVGGGVGEGGTLVHVQLRVEGAVIANVVTAALPEAGTLPVPVQPEQ